MQTYTPPPAPPGTRPITLAADFATPSPQRRLFLVTPPTRLELARDLDALHYTVIHGDGRRELCSRQWEQSYSLVRAQLAAVRNLADAAGTPQAWPALGTAEDKAAFLELVPLEDVFELAELLRNGWYDDTPRGAARAADNTPATDAPEAGAVPAAA